jgi:hypothetical protein
MPKRGMSVNLITKSGGNTYHGALEGSFTNSNFESDNITPALKKQGGRVCAESSSRGRTGAASLEAS